jgi:hypothetical protein
MTMMKLPRLGRAASIVPAGRVAKTNKPETILDNTCLDAKDTGADAIELDDREWHKDSRFDDYGEHLTFSLYREGKKFDTCHVYQEKTKEGCLVTFCQRKYNDKAITDGRFWGYFG